MLKNGLAVLCGIALLVLLSAYSFTRAYFFGNGDNQPGGMRGNSSNSGPYNEAPFETPPRPDAKNAPEPLRFTLLSDSRNVLAWELPGKWVVNVELTKRFGVEPEDKEFTLEFMKQQRNFENFTETAQGYANRLRRDEPTGTGLADLMLAAQNIWRTGIVRYPSSGRERSYDFALTTVHGNAYVYIATGPILLERHYVAIGADESGNNDLLFWGKDETSKSITVFERKAPR